MEGIWDSLAVYDGVGTDIDGTTLRTESDLKAAMNIMNWYFQIDQSYYSG